MNVQTLLNTNRSSAASPEPRNMQYEQPSVMPPHHDLTSPSNYALQNALYEPPPPQTQPARVKTESEGNPPTPQSSESSRFPSHAPSVQHGYPPQSHSQALPTDYRYDSPGFAQPHLPLLPNGYNNTSTDDYTRSQLQSLQHPVQPAPQPIPTRTPLVSSSLPKSFACSTCNKGFARRSDLARHERIHSGERPHVCDYPGCGKQFIQRSALTVHSRVHTGEKPHMCECCAKHFSDSSSLARHRRIHSGKRPYKCPYQNCQKTFTRRTTLTRHKNHHAGTVEESQAATASALAAGANDMHKTGESDIDDSKSTLDDSRVSSEASPQEGFEQRQLSEIMAQGLQGLPPHMRPEMTGSRPSSPSSTHSYMASNRSSLGSQPVYSLPALEQTVASSHDGSVVHSPSVPGSGWQSPSHRPVAQVEEYARPPHPDEYGRPPQPEEYGYDSHTQQYVQNAQNLYYQNTQTDPMQRLSQGLGQELWTPQQ